MTTNQKTAHSENHAKKSVKVDRYLVDIKELPPISYGGKKEKKTEHKISHQIHKPTPKNKIETPPTKKESPESLCKKPAVKDSIAQTPPKKEEAPIANEKVVEKKNLPFSSRDIILGIINLISLVLLIVILNKLPEKAQELKELRIQSVKNESSVSFEFVEIEASKEKTKQLEDLFLDEAGIVNFVGQVEKLKTEGSAIGKITFANQKVIKDKTGNYGIPIIIEMNGTWQAIGQSLQEIEELSFLLRTVNIDAEPDKENEGVIQFKYGGFLYVDTRLGKN